jgi:primosomal protein N'
MPAPDTCPVCGGWRLKERGIGIQHVYDDLTRKYEARFITLMDRESASSHKKAVVLRDAFFGNPGGIMLGTALSLPYLSRPVDISAVISMDSLRALPSWRQEEETMSILCHLREKTRGSVYVQTRAEEDDELFGFARQGMVAEFFERELALREAFKYPPYTVFIHLAWRETGLESASALRKLIAESFAPYGISIYSAPHRTPEGGVGFGLLRIERNAWPHEEIVARLKRLPPSVRIMLNPDRII